jgi:hypothetical protein
MNLSIVFLALAIIIASIVNIIQTTEINTLEEKIEYIQQAQSL